MPKFEVYNEQSLIGWSELELGDPPMGVAFGQFIPAPDYGQVQAAVVGGAHGELSLWVRVAEGQVIEAAGVHIEDHSAELGAEGREVSVLGISNPPYESLFPHHVAAYERQFSSDG